MFMMEDREVIERSLAAQEKEMGDDIATLSKKVRPILSLTPA